MKLKACWMYHDIMDLYGDAGNIMVLRKRCEAREIEFEVQTCTISEEIDLALFDLVIIGGGADIEQKMISVDLIKRKSNILDALKAKTFFFLVCGGFQLFGKYYKDANNEKINGLGIYDYFSETISDEHRCVGNIVINSLLDGVEECVIGFENHGGQTFGVKNFFGKIVHGYGNNSKRDGEGFYDGHVLGTYIHGPLLPKNPGISDFLITKALQKNNPEFSRNDLKKIEDNYAEKAKAQILSRMG